MSSCFWPCPRKKIPSRHLYNTITKIGCGHNVLISLFVCTGLHDFVFPQHTDMRLHHYKNYLHAQNKHSIFICMLLALVFNLMSILPREIAFTQFEKLKKKSTKSRPNVRPSENYDKLKYLMYWWQVYHRIRNWLWNCIWRHGASMAYYHVLNKILSFFL